MSLNRAMVLLLIVFAFSLVPLISLAQLAHAATIDKKVASSTDDAYEANGKMVVGGKYAAAGKDDDGIIYRGGYRFTNLAIPNGAKITSANLVLSYNWRRGPNANTDLYGQNADNAAAFGTGTNDISSRAKTAAKADWNNMPGGLWGTRTTSPDISSIVQEIVNRPGWSSGNSIAILQYADATATDEWESVSYEGYGYPLFAPALKVAYDGAAPPPAPAKKVIIFRDDDAQTWWDVGIFKNITNTLIAHNIPQTIGVLPGLAGGYDIGDDPEFKSYLNSIKGNGKVELALHGYQHTVNEFKYLTYAQAKEKIQSGLNIFQSELGMRPTTFIPPYHTYSAATLDALADTGFTRFSAATYADPYSWKEYPAGLLHVSSTAPFDDWNPDLRHRAYGEITGDCQEALDAYDVCLILLHHWSFSDDDKTINPAQYKTLLDVIGWAHSKEADGVKLMTVKEYAQH